MIQFFPRTIKQKGNVVQLYQAAEIAKGTPVWVEGQTAPLTDGSCHYCLYRTEWTNMDEFDVCQKAHRCMMGVYPYIRMMRAFNAAGVEGGEDPGGLTYSFLPTGVFRQVKFEGMPLYIQLYKIGDDDNLYPAQCNADCHWHAWRMANQRTWRQCGQLHVCGNNGSCWLLMLPSSQTLFDEFCKQF